ncbi:hypothetical protein R1sor_021454 [Riccia sorocarpa]|uniref:Uncharacterized protein n=1 Tax=Riccia sorocarpa TaxID=122646 RepID=A0ABD3GH59_9MARC
MLTTIRTVSRSDRQTYLRKESQRPSAFSTEPFTSRHCVEEAPTSVPTHVEGASAEEATRVEKAPASVPTHVERASAEEATRVEEAPVEEATRVEEATHE